MTHRLSSRALCFLVSAVVALPVLASCSGSAKSSGSGSDSAGSQYVQGTGEISTVPAKDRGAPLNLSGDALIGGKLSVADYLGKVVVVNVWGAWCNACRAEAAGLESVFTKTQAKGVQFVGIDTRDLQTTQPMAFLASHKITYPNFYDPAGELLLAFPRGTLNPQFIPTTIVLDRQGRIAARSLEAVTSDQLMQMLSPVLAEKS